ncbi:PAS domain S-box protein [Christiangramia portivictoriae]|uniref:PAS domain S-box protein n=1 Tax=Christiangramia portivictoriae TaxID=326069 RepID=UPI00047A85DE|nr:PAS domain S-box protein [Christiangramia portivictoriae]
MNNVSINSITETVITFSYIKGVTAFDNAAAQFFEENFTSEIVLHSTLFTIFPSELAAQLNEKMTFCKKGRFQTHTYQKNLDSPIFSFYIAPIIAENHKIESISLSIEKTQQTSGNQENLLLKELNYKTQFYSNLFYHNPDAVFLFDQEGNFINVNAQSARIAETTEEELLQMHFLPFIPEKEKEQVLTYFGRALKGESLDYQCSFISAKGNHKYLEVKNFPIVYQQETIGVYGIAKDITEKLEIERKRRADKQMLRAIIDNIPDYIFVKDRQNRSILTNKKFATNIIDLQTLGTDLNTTPFDYFEESKAKEIVADNNAVMNTGKAVYNRQDIVVKSDGSQEMVLLTKVPLRDTDNKIVGLVGIARNNTEAFLQNKRKDLILKTLKAFGDTKTFKEATIKTLEIFCRELGYEYAEAYKLSANKVELIRTSYWPENLDLQEGDSESVRYKEGQGLPGKVWSSMDIEIIHKEENTGLLKNMMLNDSESIHTAVGIPIIMQGRLISILCFGSKLAHKKIERSLYSDVSIQIASAMERKLSQNQLSDFFEYSPNLIAVIGLDGYIKMANPAFVKTFNYSTAEMLSEPFSTFIHPEDLEKTFEAINLISIGGEDFEIRCRQKNGDYIWISWRFSRFFENENIVYIYGTNVTAIKEHESLLRNSEKRFKALVQEGSDHIAILDKEMKFIYNSPGTDLLYGYSVEQLAHTHFKKRVIEEDWSQIAKILEKLKEGQRVQLPSYRVQGQKDKIHWIETIATNLSNDDAVGGIVLNSRDITEFIIQARQLIESLRRYDIVAKATSDIIIDFHIATGIMKASNTLESVFGWTSEDNTYTSEWWNDKIHPEDYDEVRKAAQDLIENKIQHLTIEYRFRCADGSYKYILDRSHLMYDDGQKPLRIIGSLQDITERKSHLIAIQNHNKRLKEIAWTQSHVVRAPLAKIMGLVDLMMNYREDLDNIDEILENILISANELDGIIREIAEKSENEL